MTRIALPFLLLPFSIFAQTDGQILIQKFAQTAPDSTPLLLLVEEMWFDTAGEILKTRTPGMGESYYLRHLNGLTETTFSRPFENQTVKRTLIWPVDSDKPEHRETVRCTRFATGDTVMKIATWVFDELEPMEVSVFVRQGDTIKVWDESRSFRSKWGKDHWVLDSTGVPVRGWDMGGLWGDETSWFKDSIVVGHYCLLCGVYREIRKVYLLNEQGQPIESFRTEIVMSDTSARSLDNRFYYDNPYGLLSKIEIGQKSSNSALFGQYDLFGVHQDARFVVRSNFQLSQAAVLKINNFLLPSPSRLFFLAGSWRSKNSSSCRVGL